MDARFRPVHLRQAAAHFSSRHFSLQDCSTFIIFKRGGMGSVLTSMPFVASLKASAPAARILFVTDRGNQELVERCRIADDVVVIDRPRPLVRARRTLALVGKMRHSAPAVFFDLQLHTYRRSAAWLAAASGAALRVGFFRPGDSLRQHWFDTLILANMFAPVHELYLQMARAIGCAAPDAAVSVPLRVDADDRAEAAALLDGWGAPRRHLLVVNPNTSSKATVRRWPLAHFHDAIARIMAQRDDVRIALIGAAEEFGLVERLRVSLGAPADRVRNLAGRTSLGGLLAVLQRADCLLTNDSGPFHFGVALGAPTVGLFGPVHPDHYARMGRPETTIIFYHPMMCSPCVHVVRTPPCGGDNQCMQTITPEEVSDACLLLLAGRRGGGHRAAPGWQFATAPRTVTDDGGALGVWHRPGGEAALRLTASC